MTSDIAKKYADTIYISFSYILLYYAFLIGQVVCTYFVHFQAKRDSKGGEKINMIQTKYESRNRLKLAGDRAVGNTLEQMIPFLGGLWTCSVFVSVEEASWWGWMYVITRSVYPFLFYVSPIGPYKLVSTIPGYLAIAVLWYKTYNSAS
jgi:hypothetical protein